MKRKKLSSGKLFYQLSLLFCISFTVPLIMLCGCFYLFSTNAVQKEVETSNRISLTHIASQVDDYIGTMKRITLEYTTKDYLEKIASYTGPVTSQNEYIKDYQKQVLNTITVNSYINDVFVYFPQKDLLLSSRGQFTLDTYFGKKTVYDGISTQDWAELIEQGGIFRLLGSRRVVETRSMYPSQMFAVTMITSLPAGSSSPLMVIGLIVNENAFRALLVKTDLTKEGELYLLDADSVFLADSVQSMQAKKTPEEVFDRARAQDEGSYLFEIPGAGKSMVSFYTSSLSGLKVVSLTPYGEITESADQVRDFSYLVAGIFILIGILVSYLVCSRFCRPIEELASNLSEGQMPKPGRYQSDEYRTIYRRFDMVTQKNRQLQNTLNRNMSILRRRLLLDWVNRKYPDTDFLHFRMNDLGLQFQHPFFYVALIKFEFHHQAYLEFGDSIKNIRSGICTLIAACGKTSDCQIEIAETDEEDCIAVINAGQAEIPRLYQELKGLLALLDSESALLRLTISLPPASGAFEDVPELFNRAEQIARYRTLNRGSQLLDGLNPEQEAFFRYPPQTEEAIINRMLTGDWQAALALVQEVLTQNIEGGLPYEILSNSLSSLFLTLTFILDRKRIPISSVFEHPETIYSELRGFSNLESAVDFFKYAYEKVGAAILKTQKDSGNELLRRVTEYLEENYHRLLSLEMVSEAVGSSPKYISTFFKEHTGVNFTDYLCRLRIRKAKTLLTDPDKKVKDICLDVGFENVNSFIRMFKRYEGISPGQYRQLLSRKEE